MKRTIAIFLSLTLIVTSLCTVASPAFGVPLYDDVRVSSDGDWKYVVQNDGTAKITDYNGLDLILKIPEQIDGLNVTEIGTGAFYGSDIASVSVPYCVKTIGWWAFYGCNFLSEVKLASGVQRILFGAFINCLELREIELPPTVYQIDNDAFAVSVSTETDVEDSDGKRKVNVQTYFNDSDFVIRGYEGTRAETYAKESYLTFDSVGKLSFGDLNDDGVLNNKDAMLLRGYLQKGEKLTDEQKFSADLDCSGRVDDNDLGSLMRYLEGKCAYNDLKPFSGSFTRTNYLYGKSLCCIGDSVCKGTGTDIMGEKLYSYYNYLCDLYGMKGKNNSYGGITLAKQKNKKGDRRSIAERVQELKDRRDVIVVEGGFNDLFQEIKIGKVTKDSDKSGKYDEYTTAGAMEKICWYLQKNYRNSLKLFVLGHKMTGEKKQEEYWSVMRRILKKWDIPYVDISEESDFCDFNEEITDQYFSTVGAVGKGDGIHPCAYTHANIYGPIIDKKLNELAASGSSVTFPVKSVDLAMGEGYSQIPVYRGTNYFVNFKFSSSEPDIVSVDKFGKVKANGVGTAYIKVEADDGTFGSYEVNVKKLPLCVFLNERVLELRQGDSYQLREILLRGTASYRNTFISTNPSVISVSADGVVKARGAGTAKVVCKACNGVTAECTVTVTEAE